MSSVRTLVVGLLCAFAVSFASASVIQRVELEFESGATFSGVVTFADDFSYYTAVDGTLYGYQFGTTGYLGTGSDAISWVWGTSGDGVGSGIFANYSTLGAGTFQNWLMDGSQAGGYYNFITFGYTYTAAGIAGVFAGGLNSGSVTNVNYVDPLVRGSVSSVPEPATLGLLGLGLAGIAFFRRKRGT